MATIAITVATIDSPRVVTGKHPLIKKGLRSNGRNHESTEESRLERHPKGVLRNPEIPGQRLFGHLAGSSTLNWFAHCRGIQETVPPPMRT